METDTEQSPRRANLGHAAVCEWHEAHPETGKRWQDMTGSCEEARKLNFFLYRRGLMRKSKDFGRPGMR